MAKETGTRLEDDWWPSDALQIWVYETHPHWTEADFKFHTDDFRDFWHSATGTKARKLNWDATFRNWMRRQKSNSRVSTRQRGTVI